jgi:F-type H+-transporting ATPase subunit epsilon
MNTFTLRLQDTSQAEEVEGVTAFVGEDTSGSFGILAGHARFMTSLVMGLARYRVDDEDWQYLAVPGALLYFRDNTLTLNTRRYFRDSDYTRISAVLQDQLLKEEENLHVMKESLHRMEEEVLRRMWEIKRGEAG